MDPELDFGRGPFCLFHVRSFLTLLFSIGNIAIWGGGARPPGSAFDDDFYLLSCLEYIRKVLILGNCNFLKCFDKLRALDSTVRGAEYLGSPGSIAMTKKITSLLCFCGCSCIVCT